MKAISADRAPPGIGRCQFDVVGGPPSRSPVNPFPVLDLPDEIDRRRFRRVLSANPWGRSVSWVPPVSWPAGARISSTSAWENLDLVRSENDLLRSRARWAMRRRLPFAGGRPAVAPAPRLRASSTEVSGLFPLDRLPDRLVEAMASSSLWAKTVVLRRLNAASFSRASGTMRVTLQLRAKSTREWLVTSATWQTSL